MKITRNTRRFPGFLAALSLLIFASVLQGFAQQRPKLILQITVDQLRGDLPAKYLDRCSDGGFRYLLNNGIVYGNAQYAHANTETAVGHTALATGAYPSVSGIISNDWFDVKTGKYVYAVEDDGSPVLPFYTSAADSISGAIRPDEPGTGRSPVNIVGTTFGDELNFYSAGQSKVFGISVKDRGSITLAGHSGKAFWFDTQTGDFVTSRYYYSAYPQWVREWNLKRPADRYDGKSWELLYPENTYIYGNQDDQPFELNMSGYGRTFPHHYGQKDNKNFYRYLTVSPAGDEILLDFAKALITSESLGRHTVTDYLSVSFSCTDYIDHTFSPSSLEAEDNLLRLDRDLSELFRFIDQKVGLQNTLIVLSADHGASEAPELAKSMGLDAGRLVMSDVFRAINDDLKQKFGVGREVIRNCNPPFLYLDHDLIRQQKVNEDDLIHYLCRKLEETQGIEMAVSIHDLREGKVADSPIIGLIRNNCYRERSGDLYLVGKPYWLVSADNIGAFSVASSHGTPWSYDTFVPVIFAGNNLKPQKVYRKVSIVDIAPTLSAVAGCKYPSGTCGNVLQEVLSPQ